MQRLCFLSLLLVVKAFSIFLTSTGASAIEAHESSEQPKRGIIPSFNETISATARDRAPETPELIVQSSPEILIEPDNLNLDLELVPTIPNLIEPSEERNSEELEPEVPPEETIPPQPTPSTQPQERLSEELRRTILRELILNYLNINAERYPWLINQSDRLIFDPSTYEATPSNLYFTFDTKFSSSVRIGDNEISNPILNDLKFSQFDRDEQFYWVLDDNRVVAETQGVHGDFEYQGRTTSDRGSTAQQVVTTTEGLFGVQAVWALPAVISGLFGEENPNGLSTSTIAVEISSSQSLPINSITLDTGVDLDNPSVVFLDNLDFGETFSELGGGALFENVSADNVPKFLQGFPTVNLQPLLDGEEALSIGQVISDENFAIVRERLDNVEFSSLPGVERLRPNTGANEDLVRVLANPFLSEAERNFHYLNSLLWISLGERNPDIELIDPLPGNDSEAENRFEDTDWRRFTTSLSRHRSMLQYDPEAIELDYTSIFANPGLSITATALDVNSLQTLHGTVGMLLGGLFYLTPEKLEQSLSEAREKFDNFEPLAGLQTVATSDQRRQMNIRLNRTLSQADNTSALYQASGSWTFQSNTTPDDSQLFQLRTGLFRRGVLFVSTEQELGEFRPFSPASITGLRLSSDDFGPLTFRGGRFPIETTAIDDIQRVFAVQTIIRTPDETIVASSGFPREQVATTTVPLIDPLRPFDIVFDLIELSRSRTRDVRTSSDIYNGYLYLPATELLMAGSEAGLNYGVALGSWVNFAPDAAPGVDHNQAQELDLDNFTHEPSLGLYLKALSNWVFQQVQVNEDQQVTTVTTHIPFVNLQWNSAANRLNENYILAGYQFSWRNQQLGLTLTPSLIFTPQSLNATTTQTSQGNITANLAARFFTQEGLDTRINFEAGDNFFFNAEATYQLIRDTEFGILSVGGYYSNSNTLSRGLTTRVADNRLGLIFNYEIPQEDSTLNLRLGTSETGFEALLEGNFRVSF